MSLPSNGGRVTDKGKAASEVLLGVEENEGALRGSLLPLVSNDETHPCARRICSRCCWECEGPQGTPWSYRVGKDQGTEAPSGTPSFLFSLEDVYSLSGRLTFSLSNYELQVQKETLELVSAHEGVAYSESRGGLITRAKVFLRKRSMEGPLQPRTRHSKERETLD